MGLLNLLNKQKTLTMDDLSSINELLKAGLSIKDCLFLIKTKSNNIIIETIISKLNKGLLIEEIMINFLPKKIASYIKELIKNMSFSESLELSLNFLNKNLNNQKTIEKNILYPVILLFIAISALYLFDAYGLDAIINMLKTFKSDFSSLTILRNVFRIIIYIFYFGMLIIMILIIYFSKEKNIALMYIFVSKHIRNSLIQVYFCEEFINLFLICLDSGYKTKEVLNILKALHNKPIVSFLAFHLEESLLKGNSLKDASKQIYFDETLSKFINVAVYTNDFSFILHKYLTLCKEKIISFTKKIILSIQISSYIFIGVIIIFVYQILFLPMQMIGNF